MEMHTAIALLKRAEKIIGQYVEHEPVEMCAFAELWADIESALYNDAGVSTSIRKHGL